MQARHRARPDDARARQHDRPLRGGHGRHQGVVDRNPAVDRRPAGHGHGGRGCLGVGVEPQRREDVAAHPRQRRQVGPAGDDDRLGVVDPAAGDPHDRRIAGDDRGRPAVDDPVGLGQQPRLGLGCAHDRQARQRAAVDGVDARGAEHPPEQASDGGRGRHAANAASTIAWRSVSASRSPASGTSDTTAGSSAW